MNPPYYINPNATSTKTFDSVCLPFKETKATTTGNLEDPDCKSYAPDKAPTFPLKLVAKKTDQHDCEIVKGKINSTFFCISIYLFISYYLKIQMNKDNIQEKNLSKQSNAIRFC